MPYTFIYSLSDPITGEIRYVGKTVKSLAKRLSAHLRERCNPHRVRWIAKLLRTGLKPKIALLETVDGDWAETERRWIRKLRKAGHNLLNKTEGGEGAPGRRCSEETRQKLSNAMAGRSPPRSTIEASLAARRGRTHSFEYRQRMSQIKKGTQNGSKHGMAVLTEEEVIEIRQELAEGISGAQIARNRNISQMTVSNIKNRKTWGHV